MGTDLCKADLDESQWVSFASGDTFPFADTGGDGGDDPPSDPADWQTAIDSAVSAQDWQPIIDWYTANTGHEGLGYAEEDLTAGTIVSSYDGQVFEGISASVIRISHNNVTVRGCRVLNGGQYGAYFNPTYDAPVTGVVIEYCTFVSDKTYTTDAANYWAYIEPALTGGDGYDTIIRNCNAYGWSSGILISNKVSCEYCYVHDLQHPDGVHSSSLRQNHGSGGRAYRNYCTAGNSNVMGIYFDKVAINDVTFQENILTGQSPLTQPSYLLSIKRGAYSGTATGIKFLNNMFGPGYQYGYAAYGGGSGDDVPWGTNGNECSGNYDLMSGTPQGNAS